MDKIADELNKLIDAGVAFYVYREAGKDNVCFGCQITDGICKIDSVEDIRRAGFIMAPFSEKSDELIFLKGDISVDDLYSQSENLFVDLLKNHIVRKPLSSVSEEYIVSKEEYLKQCSTFISEIKKGRVDKVILSRIVKDSRVGLYNAGMLFESLLKNYPDSFTFLVNLPGSFAWCGASPETLLKVENQNFQTMSLAGSQKWLAGYSDNLSNWSNKDKNEQQIVTEYITRTLRNIGLDAFSVDERRVVKAGGLAHLMTMFNGSLNNWSGGLQNLINAMNPTPAVCGNPKQEAMRLISEVEQHRRSYYAGYIGPVDERGNVSLYVNLRCAKICEKSMFIYIGSGITQDSHPESEWLETCFKSDVILNAIE